MLLLFAGLSVFYPLVSILALSNTDEQSLALYYSADGYKIAMLVVFIIVAAFIPLLVYRYMVSKKDLDVYHSLPIKRSTLFLSNFLASMLIAIIPFIGAWVFGYLVHVFYGLEPSFLYLLAEIGIVFVFLPIIMFPAVFAINNIGTLFDTFVYTVIIHVLPFIAMLVILLYGNSVLFANNVILTFEFNTYLSPLVAFVGATMFESFDFHFFLSFILWPILGFVLIYVNRVLYDKRKVENVEQPMMNRWFNPLIVFILTILVLLIALYAYNFTNISGNVIEFLYPVVFVLVLYLFLDAINHRGFKHFFKAIIEYAVLLAIAIGIMFALKSVNGFGFDFIIPEVSEVDRVVISSHDQLNFTTQYNDNFSYGGESLPYHYHYEIFQEEEEIKQVIDFHEYAVETYYTYFDDKREFEDTIYYYLPQSDYQNNFQSKYAVAGIDKYDIYDDIEMYDGWYPDATSIRIDYYLSNGNHYYRSYEMPVDWTYDLYVLGN